MLLDLINNQVIIAGLVGWSLAQAIKVPLEYVQTHKWNWSLLFRAGGMPSSHSALVSGISLATGLYEGMNTAVFALSVAVAMVVIYDATGIRRQAGKHAELINAMIDDLASGHPLKEETLREVLGHTPIEAMGGMLLGLLSALLLWAVWR
ncbi:MAG: divergent PAP2 family protein [Anaerolineales bacterium]|nr:divergent PAP2 family protein [Anaerolineales bacterium]